MTKELAISDNIKNKIYTVRGKQVMLDRDLAELYCVSTKVLNQAVKRNKERFPEDFCFQLSLLEKEELVTNCDHLSPLKFSYVLPHAFTEQGVSMLSAVLKSKKAVEISINIMNAFVAMKKYLSNNKYVFEKFQQIDQKLETHDEQFNKIFKALESKDLPEKGIFFDGQVFDAYKFIIDLIKSANTNIVFSKYLNNKFLFIGLINLKIRKMLKKTHKILDTFIKNPTKTYLFEEIKKHTNSSSDSYTYESLESFVKNKILIKEKRGGVSFYKLAKTPKTISYLTIVSEYIAWNNNISETINDLIKKTNHKFFSLLVVGSYAKGTQTQKSDLDVIIISNNTKKIYAELRQYCELNIPQIHLHVFTEEEFKQMLLSDDYNYGKEAVKNNLIFFGADTYYKIIFEAIKNGFSY